MAYVILLLSALTAVISGGDITLKPEDVTAELGTDARINCEGTASSSGAFQWSRLVDRDQPEEMLFFVYTGEGEIYKPEKYNVSGQYNLIVKEVTFNDAGRYTCRIYPSGASYVVTLVVLEKPAILSETEVISGEESSLECEVRFGGPPRDQIAASHFPHIKAFLNGILLSDGEEDVQEGESGVAPWRIRQIVPHTFTKDDDQHLFVCEARTTTPYKALTTETMLQVKYDVDTINLEPTLEEYNVGDYINCTANGNPSPTITWSATVTPGSHTVFYTSQLPIELNMVGVNEWKCAAQNQVSDLPVQVEKTIKFTVFPKIDINDGNADTGGSTMPASATIGIAVAVPVIVILVVVIVVFVFCRRKKAKEFKPKEGGANYTAGRESDSEDEEHEPTANVKFRPDVEAAQVPKNTSPETEVLTQTKAPERGTSRKIQGQKLPISQEDLEAARIQRGDPVPAHGYKPAPKPRAPKKDVPSTEV